MAERRLSAVIAGCAHIHVRDFTAVLLDHPAARPIAVWDDDPALAAPWAERLGLPVTTDLAALPAADLWVIASDTRSHERLVEAAIGRAGALFFEKPLGIGAEGGARLAARLQASGLPVAMDYFFRAVPAVQQLRRWSEDGTLGRLRHVTFCYQHPGLLEGGLKAWPALLDRARMGHGGFGDLAVHLIDLAGWIGGPLEPLACALEGDGAGSDCQGSALLRVVGGPHAGALVTLRAGTVLRGPRIDLRLDGEAGSAQLREGELWLHEAGKASRQVASGIEARCPAGLSAWLHQLAGHQAATLAGPADAARVDNLLENLHRLAGF
ncbi:Gfo/Idh/MocA family protein [Radicibacter daui]|uniref:Gfo/Idh/MocA family protein n=1 Tax=Radicibacter daui TaxID=3064829 RepID=UPI004046D3B5